MSKPTSTKNLTRTLKKLETWFERQKRVLPWRDSPSIYRVWISEIMLQQTQVATVVPYFEKFMARFPTVEDLARAPLDDVLLMWAGLGYYSRARNLHRAAKIFAEQGFPKTREGWLAAPGIGPYTAGAILSIALDHPEPILDGNVERVISRLQLVDHEAGDTKYRKSRDTKYRKSGGGEYKNQLWNFSIQFVEKGYQLGIRPSALNQGLMELGAMICVPKNPRCLLCPVSRDCGAFTEGHTEDFPPKKKPKNWVDVREELHLVIDDGGRILVKRRSEGEWRAGLWDLVEGKPKRISLKKIGVVESSYRVTRHKVSRTTHVWRASAPREWRVAEAWVEIERWIPMDQPSVAVGSALKQTLNLARERFPEAWPRNSEPGSESSR